MALAARDLKLRYKQTALGTIWVILQPLLGAGIFSIVFGRVARFLSDGVPYFLFGYARLLGWNIFSDTLSKTSSCLLGSAHLIRKIFFPRLAMAKSVIAFIFRLYGFGSRCGRRTLLQEHGEEVRRCHLAVT